MRYYYVHDNGGRPFKVKIYPNHKINIFKFTDVNKNGQRIYDELALEIPKYEKIFIGKDPENLFFSGNSILIKIKDHEYIFVGFIIYKFQPLDDILEYISPVENNDVPYPYAIGEKNTYLMINYVYIPNNKLLSSDPYNQYYDHKKKYKNEKILEHKYTIKMLHDRL